MKAPRYDRSQAVGSDHKVCSAFFGFSIGIERFDTCDAAVGITHDVSDTHAFFHASAGGPCTVEQNRVEDCSSDRDSVIRESPEPVIRGELAVNGRTIRRMHPHSGQLCRARELDFVERIHLRKNSRGLRTQVFGAGLVAREARAIEHDYVDSSSREEVRSRCATGSAAHDYYHEAADRTCVVRSRFWKMPMYCQCGFGNRITDAARVSHGRISERESAENMKRGCLAANCFTRLTA